VIRYTEASERLLHQQAAWASSSCLLTFLSEFLGGNRKVGPGWCCAHSGPTSWSRSPEFRTHQ
jgi:hypothetical protein